MTTHKKLRKLSVIGLILLMSLSVGSISANASSNHTSHWSWEKSLSVHRALKNTSHKKDSKIRHQGKHQRMINKRIKCLYLNLRHHGFSRNQSIATLMVVHNFHSGFKNHFNKSDRNAGYFNLNGISRTNYLSFAHSDRLNPDMISSQLTFIVKMFGNRNFMHEFKSNHESPIKLAKSMGYHLITGTNHSYTDYDYKMINQAINK